MPGGPLSGVLSAHIRPILGAIKSVPVPVHEPGKTAPVTHPFITISREPGAGGRTLAAGLLERLARRDPGEPPWSVWDREIVEKVARDFHISAQLIESIEKSGRSWLEQLLGGLMSHDVDDLAIYRRVAATIRALAQVGRTIIVGRGGIFITQHMPGGIHVRLVAPRDARVERMIREEDMTRQQATLWVTDMETRREAFYRRHFPRHALTPEMFTVTFNTAQIDDERLANAVGELIGWRNVPV